MRNKEIKKRKQDEKTGEDKQERTNRGNKEEHRERERKK